MLEQASNPLPLGWQSNALAIAPAWCILISFHCDAVLVHRGAKNRHRGAKSSIRAPTAFYCIGSGVNLFDLYA